MSEKMGFEDSGHNATWFTQVCEGFPQETMTPSWDSAIIPEDDFSHDSICTRDPRCSSAAPRRGAKQFLDQGIHRRLSERTPIEPDLGHLSVGDQVTRAVAGVCSRQPKPDSRNPKRRH
jgi:hypothetical protein